MWLYCLFGAVFRGVLRPRMHEPVLQAVFPETTVMESHVDDVVLTRFLAPQWRNLRATMERARVFQQGNVQAYVLYILIILAVLLLSMAPIAEVVGSVLRQ